MVHGSLSTYEVGLPKLLGLNSKSLFKSKVDPYISNAFSSSLESDEVKAKEYRD
jgi:hypothetical protein